ncbi:MAG: SLC13 family permease [Planctomycetia bacterium]|nr:SLC13 family permease [Planctomycetia bacterium]
MAFTRVPPDVALIGGVVLLFLAGILTAKEAVGGMANEGMLTVGALFVVAAGIVETGAVLWISTRLFGRPRTMLGALCRLVFPTMTLSAFMNNTPLVAMLIPAVSDWVKKNRMRASKFMIPLSYAAILGGTCTLIGTSTNLVVQGLWIEHTKGPGLGMFTISWVGVPVAIVGGTFLLLAARWLLPDRKPPISIQDDPREYTIEMLVEPDSPLVGKTIEQAGLRHLERVYLAELDRDGMVFPAVSPEEKLRAGDRLVFVGIVDSIVDLQKVRGLVPATDQVFKLGGPRSARCLTEAVVSDSCPVVGKTIRDGRFRSMYGAAVIAVARNGERIRKKIGDIVLAPGDTLLLESSPSFEAQQRNSRDFYLVSSVEGSSPPRHERAPIALAILLLMVAAVTVSEAAGWPVTMFKAALAAAGLMIATRCVGMTAARRSVDWQVLLAIAASFGLSAALEKTGAAAQMISLLRLGQGSPWLALALIYLLTMVMTELITNNAAAALMFPFAMATAKGLGVDKLPFVIVVMIAASAGFATPIGYQTNLMVYGPGGYRFGDYVKIGAPMDLLVMAVALMLTPLFFPFHPS